MGKARLKLVVTDLMIARVALRAGSAAADKWQGDAIARVPVGDVGADSLNDSGKLMARHMWKADIRIMSHPAVPITATQTRCFDRDHHAAVRGFGVRQLLDAQ